MPVFISSVFKTPAYQKYHLPNGYQPSPGEALVAFAHELTLLNRYEKDAGNKDVLAMSRTLNKARILSNYHLADGIYVYEDENITVTIDASSHEARTKPKLFLDSDGVFYDFENRVFSFTGSTIKELGDDEMWKRCGPYAEFWNDMPLLAGAQDFWNLVKGLDPVVLTGCPKTDFRLAANCKRACWKRDFGFENLITCLSKDKALFVEHPGDVLVDDTYRNIKRWRDAGGVGILFQNPDQTISELKGLGLL